VKNMPKRKRKRLKQQQHQTKPTTLTTNPLHQEINPRHHQLHPQQPLPPLALTAPRRLNLQLLVLQAAAWTEDLLQMLDVTIDREMIVLLTVKEKGNEAEAEAAEAVMEEETIETTEIAETDLLPDEMIPRHEEAEPTEEVIEKVPEEEIAKAIVHLQSEEIPTLEVLQATILTAEAVHPQETGMTIEAEKKTAEVDLALVADPPTRRRKEKRKRLRSRTRTRLTLSARRRTSKHFLHNLCNFFAVTLRNPPAVL